jgi:anaerobic selenocysteine-containing dehydrogenase
VVEVDRSEKRVITIRGDDDDPRSRGYICPKAYAVKEVYEDPDRIQRPLRRTDDGWEELGWDEALDLVAERLRAIRAEHGKDAISQFIGNPNGFNFGAMMYTPFFTQALNAERVFSASSVDQLAKNVSSRLMWGDAWLFAVPDLDRTDFLLALGANPLVSNGSMMSAPNVRARLEAFRGRGGKLVVVDPRRTETAAVADQHVFIRPGGDAFFLFALINVLFEEDRVKPERLSAFTNGIETVRELAKPLTPEAVVSRTGIAPEVTRKLAREFAAASRGACYGRFGTCTQEFGTLASWLVDVVNVLTGNLDRVGGMMFPRPSTGNAEAIQGDSGPVPFGRFRSRVRGLPEFDGYLPVAAMAEEIDSAGNDRIRAMVIVAGNPVLSTPNGDRLSKAFEQLDFMVSIDIYLNETSRLADVILPTTTQLEHENFDFLIQTTSVRNFARYSPQVFDPPPDSKHHWQVLLEVAARLNGTTAETLDALLFDGMLAACVGQAGGRCAQVTHEQARKQLGEVRGPARLLDLMLRAGPYGDGFEDTVEGLSLDKLRRIPHAVDLGPLQPRLPEILRTGDRRIQLAHDLLVEDVGRLRHALQAPTHEGAMVLVGRRQMRNMNTWLHNAASLAKGKNRCTLLINSEDARRLGIADGETVRVRSRVGEVVVPAQVGDEMMPGVVSLPHGFGHRAPGMRIHVAQQHQPGANSNQLADELGIDKLSGASILNGIPVDISPH